MTIITEYEFRPIPIRNRDWIAYSDEYEGAPDGRSLIGWGATEAEAIADLKQKMALEPQRRAAR